MKEKRNLTNGAKKKTAVFHPALLRRSGLNMRGFPEKMSLVTTGEQDKSVEAEKGKNSVHYEEISPASTGADAHHQFLWHETPTQAHRLREAPGHGRGKKLLF
jgi:hypothetical protein